MNSTLLKAASALALTIGLTAPAQAIDIPGTSLSLSGTATYVTDYRFRGISQSSGKGSIQGALTVSHDSGFYAGISGEQVDLWDDDNGTGFKDGQDLEIDYYGGWSKKVLPPLTLDANVIYYSYPGVSGAVNYGELNSSATLDIGLVSAKLGASYFPDQKSTAGSGTHMFGEATATIPLLFALTAHVGRQGYSAGFGPDADYTEWSLTAAKSFGPVKASLSYVDTNLPSGMNAGATVMGSLSVGF